MVTMKTQDRNPILGLGSREAELLLRLASEGKRIFSFKDALSVSDLKSQTLKKVLYRLAKKRWVLRLEKGKYLIIPFEAGPLKEFTEDEFIIASSLIEPYYIGFLSALNYYGWTEKASPIIYIVTTKRKSPLTINGVRYQFVTFSKKRFFGQTQVWIGGKKVSISSPEKTILDSLFMLEYAGGVVEVAKALYFGRGEIEIKKLIRYGKKIGSKAVMQRLGFLLEFMSLSDEKLLEEICSLCGKGFVRLDTVGEEFGRYNSKWKIRVNISLESLLEWQRH